ncbi:hypothetical protein SAMN04488523_106156 [Sulfitobacter brevis]|uniref:Uncharacterized protein n=1 Tax=Sulfitobacter brevis TaxID=74348 RepID=A0A1I1ZHA7_9RHOB|nr:hypothetical protein [Sulfitobacter brevis]SFE31204.1 hypothetical protein SAMN04488523_106156 [Sulfitobacter brevis]
MARSPIFLERRSYRVRRMMDAVRLLPVLGLALFMVPLIWPVPSDDPSETMPMSTALEYLFGAWMFLVLAGWLLWRRTGAHAADPASDPAAKPPVTEAR